MVQVVETILAEDKDCLTYKVNNMSANGQPMQGARASVATVLTSFSWNILFSALEVWYVCRKHTILYGQICLKEHNVYIYIYMIA